MATPSVPQLITIEEYLSTNYEQDLEFVDGAVLPRTGVDDVHGLVLAAVLSWFFAHRAEWAIYPLIGYRTRTSPTRIRRPDICIVRQGEPVEQSCLTAPLICIEVVSPEDRLHQVMKRLDEFVAMGTEHIWLLDPIDRSALTYSGFGMKLLAGTRFEVAETPIYVDVEEIFATLGGKSER